MQTYRINLEEYDAEAYPGGYVEIKERRSWGASNRIDQAPLHRMSGNKQQIQQGQIEVYYEGEEKILAEVETALVAWSLPLPATREGLLSDEFDEGLGDWLRAKINEHYNAQKRTTEASLKSNASSNGSTKAIRAGRAT